MNRNFGVTATRECLNLDNHFYQYALLIWKHLNLLLTF